MEKIITIINAIEFKRRLILKNVAYGNIDRIDYLLLNIGIFGKNYIINNKDEILINVLKSHRTKILNIMNSL